MYTPVLNGDLCVCRFGNNESFQVKQHELFTEYSYLAVSLL
jgi:hypothetical protein